MKEIVAKEFFWFFQELKNLFSLHFELKKKKFESLCNISMKNQYHVCLHNLINIIIHR